MQNPPNRFPVPVQVAASSLGVSNIFSFTAPRLVIDYQFTADHNSVPSPTDDGGLWTLVTRSRGFSHWRQIRLSHVDSSVVGVCALRRKDRRK